MEFILLWLLFPLAIGLIANWIYDGALNQFYFFKNKAKFLIGDYKIYWYDTRNIKKTTDVRVSRGTVKIRKNFIARLVVDFIEDDLNSRNFTGYKYKGVMKVYENQIHWIMTGKKFNETFYAIFDRSLNRDIELIKGLFLLTANDKNYKPMSIRCLISKNELVEGMVKEQLGKKKEFLSLKN